MRVLRAQNIDVCGVDLLARPFTTHVGSISDRAFVRRVMAGVDVVFHTATLHKPHVATHSCQAFVDTNITGTLCLLEEAAAAHVGAFIYTSTTSVFGDALVPPADQPAAWITEQVRPEPKNIYGVTKGAAEDLCQLFHRNARLPCVVLRTSRFFPEEDDSAAAREAFAEDNLKLNELLHRRVDIEDVVSAHFAAAQRARDIGFGLYIISATTPFTREDLAALRRDAPAVLRRAVPEHEAYYATRGWRMNATLDRVYVNERALRELGWRPQHDFRAVLARLSAGCELRSPLAALVGYKGYHNNA